MTFFCVTKINILEWTVWKSFTKEKSVTLLKAPCRKWYLSRKNNCNPDHLKKHTCLVLSRRLIWWLIFSVIESRNTFFTRVIVLSFEQIIIYDHWCPWSVSTLKSWNEIWFRWERICISTWIVYIYTCICQCFVHTVQEGIMINHKWNNISSILRYRIHIVR